MKLAAQLYTVREFTKTDDEVKRTLARVREMGYEAVQISAFQAYNPKNIAAGLRENGLSVCATHTPLDRILHETDKVIEEHRLFGTRYVGLGWFRGESLADYEKLLADLAPAVEKIHAAGLTFLYHNHAHELIKYNGVRPLFMMKEKTQAGKFDFLPDLYWLQTAGCSPEAVLQDFKGRTPVIHLKDMRVPPKEGMTNMAEIFEGNMDYVSLIRAAEKLGVEWAAVEQDNCDGNPFESLKISYNNIKSRGLFA